MIKLNNMHFYIQYSTIQKVCKQKYSGIIQYFQQKSTKSLTPQVVTS